MDWEDRLERIDLLPETLKRALTEAEHCLDGGALVMATVAVRRGLEAICRDQGATSGNLEKKLAKLRDDGKIDGRLLEWATHLRHIGNEGAHDLDFDPDRAEAVDAQALLEGVIRYVYIDQARYEEAKARWEYRRLPVVTVKWGAATHTNGCQVVHVFRPEEIMSRDGEDDGTLIGIWTKHRLLPEHPLPVDIEQSSTWAPCREMAAEWLQLRGYRLGAWHKLSPRILTDACTDKVHKPDPWANIDDPWASADAEPPF